MKTAIIPCGFRCQTQKKISESNKVGYFPFNLGFFTSESVKKVIENEIDLNLKNTTPVIVKKTGSKKQMFFLKSTYEEINDFVKTYGTKNEIFRVLDSTNSYFTYSEEFDFILAHYNSFDNQNIEEKLKTISETLNRRRERMLNAIKNNNLILLVYENEDKTEYLKVDEKKYKLNDFENIKKPFESLHENVMICWAKDVNKLMGDHF